MVINPRWHKIIRDLFNNKTRTVLVVLAISVGIFAFGSVFITETVLISDMNTQYRSINASTITLYTDSFDDGLIRWAHRQPEVVDAQGRSSYMVKLIGRDRTFNLDLFAYDDYDNITVNNISLETGAWPPGRGEVLLERTSAAAIGAHPGDTILVEMPNGRQKELTLSGTVHDLNAVPAHLFPQLTGFVSIQTMGWLGFSTSYSRLEIVADERYRTVDQLEKVADELRSRLQRTGTAVYSVGVRAPDEHWAKEVSQSFTLILSFIGIFSLVLSGFLVINTISALITEQKKQIGMMKAIGGTGGQIAGIYLVLVTFYGLLALLVALPVGMILAYQFTRSVAQFINIDIINFHLPLQVLIMQVIAAMAVPVIASAVPVLGGVRVTVREALSTYGLGKEGKRRLFDRLLFKIRGLPRPTLLSLRNIFRRKGRLFLTMGSLAIAGTLFITVVNVRSSLMYELDDIMTTFFDYEVVLDLDDSYQTQGIERRAERVDGVIRAEAWTSASMQYIKPDETKGATFNVLGIPHDTDFIHMDLLEGRWLSENDRNAMVVTSELAKDMPGLTAGNEITVRVGNTNYQWDVVGIVFSNIESAAYANINYLSSFKGQPGMATSLHVRTIQKDGQSQDEMAKVLEKRFKDSGIGVSWTTTADTISSSNASQFDFLIAFLLAMAAMTALIGGLGLAGMMSLNVMERTREIGIMRSIGASHFSIFNIVVIEGLFIGIISWVLAIPLSIPMSLVFNSMLGDMIVEKPLAFILSPLGIIGWLAIVVVVSIIASLLPAYRATRMSIQETLAYE